MILVYFNQKPIYLHPSIAERFGLKEGSHLASETADQIIHENALRLASLDKSGRRTRGEGV